MHHLFDLSDVNAETSWPLETLDTILDTAAEVVNEYANDPQPTRLMRMAVWLANNVGGESDDRVIASFHDKWVHYPPFAWSTERARKVAVAILRAVEQIEQVERG